MGAQQDQPPAPADGRIFRYRIDRKRRIVSVNDAWLQFARDNAAPEPSWDAVAGQPLWRYISDIDTAHVYRLMLERVTETESPVEVAYRCDSPTVRRFMTLEMRAAGSGEVEFASRVLREEPRPYVALLDTTAKAIEKFVRVCSWCKKVEVQSELWLEVEYAVAELDLFTLDAACQVTHGMCPACLQGFKANLKVSSPT